MKGLRVFELFVAALVLGVVICFCIQLSLIKDTSVGEVFRGYLPSSAIVERDGYIFPSTFYLIIANHSIGLVSTRLVAFWVLLSCHTAYTWVAALSNLD
jgi:Mn2+/Fe2+ NRAMP family transporter